MLLATPPRTRQRASSDLDNPWRDHASPSTHETRAPPPAQWNRSPTLLALSRYHHRRHTPLRHLRHLRPAPARALPRRGPRRGSPGSRRKETRGTTARKAEESSMPRSRQAPKRAGASGASGNELHWEEAS
eukprot:scaffold1509_cov240-Pinguiococcus_pyrenoidosus.AAC.42